MANNSLLKIKEKIFQLNEENQGRISSLRLKQNFELSDELFDKALDQLISENNTENITLFMLNKDDQDLLGPKFFEQLKCFINTEIQNKLFLFENQLVRCEDLDRLKQERVLQLADVRKIVRFQEISKVLNIEESTVVHLIKSLLEKKQLFGRVQERFFYSQKYLEQQESVIKGFFIQNGYLEYQYIQNQVHIQKVREKWQDYVQNIVGGDIGLIFLEDCVYEKKQLDVQVEYLHESLKENGMVKLNGQLACHLTQKDLNQLFWRFNQLTIVYDTPIIISQIYLDQCVETFRNYLRDQIINNPQILVENQSQKGGGQNSGQQNKSKGKKKRYFQTDELEEDKIKENQIKSIDITGIDIVKQLKQNGILNEFTATQIYVDALMKHLPLLIQKLYQNLKENFENEKTFHSNEIYQILNEKINEIWNGILITQNSIKKIEENWSQIDLRIPTDKLLFAQRIFLENSFILQCKKNSQQVNQKLFEQSGSDILKDNQLTQNTNSQQQQSNSVAQQNNNQNPKSNFSNYLYFGNENYPKIFKCKQTFQQGIEQIKNDKIKKIFKDALDLYLKRKTLPLLHFIQKQEEFFEITSTNFNKKAFQNFLYQFRKNQTDKLNKKSPEIQETILSLAQIYLLEKHQIFFVGDQEDFKFILFNLVVIQEIEDKNSPVSQQSQNLHLIIQQLSNFNNIREEISIEDFQKSSFNEIKNFKEIIIEQYKYYLIK